MYYIYISNGVVSENIPEVHPDFPGIPIEKRYAADFLKNCIEWHEEVPQGWIYDKENNAFNAPEAVEIPVDLTGLREFKLSKNSTSCNQIIETAFKSEAKGDGLQPYRMNRDDRENLHGMNTIINNLMIAGTKHEDMPLFSWQNANQVQCVEDWHYTQIIALVMGFGEWKTLVLHRQDEIKEQILNAETKEELDAVEIDYSDLLVFDGGDTT